MFTNNKKTKREEKVCVFVGKCLSSVEQGPGTENLELWIKTLEDSPGDLIQIDNFRNRQ